MSTKLVRFDYNNHRGELTTRIVEPSKIWFGQTKFYDKPQWFLHALDLKKNVYRDFTMVDISHWEPYVIPENV